jgi:hypothetical protein
MSVNRHIHDAANNAARNVAENAARNAASTPSGGVGWIPSALKVGLVLLGAVLPFTGISDAAEAMDSLNEFGKK